MTTRPLSRRSFLRLALLPLAASALAACRIADADDPEPAPPPVDGDAVGFVYDNHVHDAVLPKAALEAGAAASLHIQGRSQHDHVIELTAAQIADIRAGREVWIRSTVDWGHFHDVVFNEKRAG